MRRKSGGFLLAELAFSVAIFAGAILLVVTFLQGASGLVSQERERLRAACRAEAVLAEVRSSGIAVKEAGRVAVKPGAGLSYESCTVDVQPWKPDPRLWQVTVTVGWKRAGGAPDACRLTTLVRKERLKTAETKP